ncbi:MAG: hypothetical protein H7124_17395 [Phycisphaerales bacterium]|nr:hypothetical protein [Hyphomonadaceae bacterium]
MIYLIGQLFIWLVLTAVSAGAAGWIYAAQRAAPSRLAMRRERDRLVRDLGRLAAGDDNAAADSEAERARAEAADSLARIRDSRIAELEHALETARSRANDVSGEAAELRRKLDQQDADAEELARLRDLNAAHEAARAQEIETEIKPAAEDDSALLSWRLRYFEQRVRYLESQSAPAAGASPLPEWRAREAQERAAYLEQQVRALTSPTSDVDADGQEAEPTPFASDADIDVLLRWRLLYLERRVAHLQAQAPAESERSLEPEPPARAVSSDPDIWRWRARYLEARVRHLEQRDSVVAEPEPVASQSDEPIAEAAPPPQVPRPQPRRGAKPAVLASARNGAPDDFTLIDSISQLQQSTLYALGVFHYDQIAAWTSEHVAWIDQHLRLQGRIDQEEWREQAADLARDGPSAARRVLEDEDA